MEKNRDSKVIAIIALVIAVVGLSVGFAAFTAQLTITPTAEVKADSSKFKVEFSNTTTAIEGQGPETVEGKITPEDTDGGASGGTASITATTMNNANAKITKDTQEVTYEWYVVNSGEMDAYLTSIDFAQDALSCTATGKGADQANTELINTACDTITVTLTVDGDEYTKDDSTMTGKLLPHGQYKSVKLSIKAAKGTTLTDNDYSVTVGAITLNYSSKDNVKQLP